MRIPTAKARYVAYTKSMWCTYTERWHMKLVRKSIGTEKEYEVWVCDVCGFESRSREYLEEHFGETHTFRAEKKILGGAWVLYWFEFEDFARKWLEPKCERHLEAVLVEWEGPGWYYYKLSPGTRELRKLESLIYSRRRQARKMLEEADTLEDALRSLGNLF